MSAWAKQDATGAPVSEAAIVAALAARSVVLVGMMGAGKSSIGRRLATRLCVPFADADNEIEVAAQMTIPDIFSTYGEAYFRSGETRVIVRLLEGEGDAAQLVTRASVGFSPAFLKQNDRLPVTEPWARRNSRPGLLSGWLLPAPTWWGP